ncbi:MAG: hypothetical protein K8J08_22735 [Thermoanaerobaculia bacterium]|nr:hypothetical protein [Thermoanaerobaculia bacterium]
MGFPPSLDRELDFRIVVYDDDGPGNAPGSLLAAVPDTALEMPILLPGAVFSVSVDLRPGSLPESGTIFLGLDWNPILEGAAFFVCADHDQPPRSGYFLAEGIVPDWTPIGDVFPGYGGMVIRAKNDRAVIDVPAADSSGLLGLTWLVAVTGLILLRRMARGQAR